MFWILEPNNSEHLISLSLKQIKTWFINVQTHAKTSQQSYLLKNLSQLGKKLTPAGIENNLMVCYSQW
jgi:hypothetical protein